MRLLFALMISFFSISLAQTNLITITGKITSRNTTKPITDCNIVINNKTGSTSDSTGSFLLHLNAGDYKIHFSHVGFATQIKEIKYNDRQKVYHFNIELIPTSIIQEEVNVFGKVKYSSVDVQVLTNDEIKKMPSFNNDVLQSVSIMPGVTANNELSSNYNVRGGSFNENLIYLNGYEIYRPFFVKNGMQENQSIANPDLVKDFNFYNGAFPAEMGDKMSSALEINYNNNFDTTLHGIIRANLLYSGLSLHKRCENFNWAAAVRYTYPSLLMKSQQVEGSYRPSFWDGQLLANYSITPNDKIELMMIYASNKFDLTPQDWQGDYTYGYWDAHSVSGNYSGNRLYSFNIGLWGIKYFKALSNSTSLTTSLSYYLMKEKENNNLTGNYYHSPDGNNPEIDKEFLKTSLETADNNLNLKAYEIKTEINNRSSFNHFSAGIDFRLTNLNGNINEYYSEAGPQATQTIPSIKQAELNYKLNSLSAYIQDDVLLSNQWKFNAGLRALHYYYNDEYLLSPRAGVFFYPSDKHTLKFMFGYYYQPPSFQELKFTDGQILKSQRAIHYILGWDFQFKERLKLLVEVYYKKLDRLIPFDLDEVKIEYLVDKITKGYARGIDLQLQGELVKGAQSWISYSYLDSREKINGEYKRRLLDQKHTLQIFLQDRFPKHPNWQAHVRMLLGSGYLFYSKGVSTNANGQKYLATYYNYRYEYTPYFRTDMGLTTELNILDDRKITIKLDVLNVFNKQNNAGYKWVQVAKDSNKAIAVLQVISGRFFNIGAELEL